MTTETSTTLRFVGDWPWWAGLTGALLLGVLAWALYLRDVKGLSWWLRTSLPVLRATAVGLMVLMLSGPILHHRTVVGQLSRLLLFVDGSKSMDLSDPSMDPGRKIRILVQLGLLKEGVVSMQLPAALEALAAAELLVKRAKGALAADTSAWNDVLSSYAGKLSEAHEALKTGDLEVGKVASFEKDLALPAREIASREMRETKDRERVLGDLDRLSSVVERWRGEIATRFTQNIQGAGEGEASPVKAALQKFDTLPRWQRLQTLLMDSLPEGVMATLAKTHAVELFVLEGGKANKVAQTEARKAVLPIRLPSPISLHTDLAGGIMAMVGTGQEQAQRSAVVLFSDGQHNSGDSPIDAAKILSGRQMPIHTVGFGSQARPRDLAILKVEGPSSVFSGDRVRGAITLKDDMQAGQPFTVAIKDGDRVLWEQQLTTEGGKIRSVNFDFPIGELAQAKLGAQRAGVQTSGVPVEVAVSVSEVGGDLQLENNHASLRVRAITQRRKILLLDGRPRWETRYLRNMFERDEQWEINAVIANSNARELGLARGGKPEQFPPDFATLSTYDLIIIGEVPRAMLKEDELQWLQDFVAQRGGAIAFIDGARNYLRGYAGTPVEPLLPVEWKDLPVTGSITRLTLPDQVQSVSAFALVPERTQNLAVWEALRAPHWLSGATPLPGAEVLVQAKTQSAGREVVPAVVYRPFGAGKVLYHAFDDSWRWRYEVGDRNHVRYWNQMANWIAELPFAVRDKFISLDAGEITYQPGESADLRVRLRDGEGRPVTDSVVDAVLSRDGKRIATIRLAPDENAGGLFRGRTAALEPGNYEVHVESVAIAERDSLARTEFKVAAGDTGELAQLALNEDLLKQIATTSGGTYLREEQMPDLLKILAPISEGKVIETETVLWQSYWWFLPLIGLLTAEWVLRKRAGLP